MPDWKAIVRARTAGQPLDDDVFDEVVQHAEELYRCRRMAGDGEDECRAAVERELADLRPVIRAARLRARAATRSAGPRPPSPRRTPVGAFAADLAYGLRRLIARPAFTAVAVTMLAFGIGANTAIYSVTRAVLLMPPPFPEPDRLVILWETDAKDPARRFIIAAPNYQDWIARARSFQQAAIWEYQNFNVSGGGEPEQVRGMRVSSSVFGMLGVPAQLGRVFTEAEDVPGHDVVVISDSLWQRRFGSSRGVIGRTMRLNGRPFEIVGVMPPHFRFTQQSNDVWVPIHFTKQDEPRDSHSFMAAARLADGVSFEAARTEFESLGRQLSAEFKENEGEGATISRLDELGVGSLRPTLLSLHGAVLLVVLIACVNVANLLLAEASARRREFSVRAALGAGSGRLASQLFAEGLVLAAAGGAAGLLLAWWATTALATQLPASITFAPFRATSTISIDASTLVVTFALAAITGVLFSVAPVLAVVRSHPGAALKMSGDRAGTPSHTKLRSVLVAAEVALAVIVLAGAGLMIKSMTRLLAIDPGLDPSNVLLMGMALPQADFYGTPERSTFCDDVARRVASLPGVLSVGAMSHVPLSGANASRGFVIEGRPLSADDSLGASYRLTCPGYFRTLGIPLTKGRDFTAADATSALPVVIINQATADRYWPDQDPLGQRLKLGDSSSTLPWLTIVGVATNVRHFGLDTTAFREIYRPYSQAAWPVMTITVKTAGEPLALASAVRSALRNIDPDQPVTAIRTMDQVIAESVGPRRFPMLLLGIFAAIALILAVIGVYGVVSCVVSQRTREIGIRMALGARPTAVTRHVVGGTLLPIVAGLVAGIGGALAASRQLSGLLYEVVPSDPSVLAAIAAILAISALAASWIPARHASSIDPLIVLKEV